MEHDTSRRNRLGRFFYFQHLDGFQLTAIGADGRSAIRGISADLSVIRSKVIGSPQYSQEGAQIFPFIFNNIAAPVPWRIFQHQYRKPVGGWL